MKTPRFRPGDSLDLLLDTMCNTFGGIIMIAILVALLTRQSSSPLVPADQARSEMMARRLATAESELRDARELRKTLEGAANPALAVRGLERKRLNKAIQEAQASATAQAVQTEKSAASKSADPALVLTAKAKQAAEQRVRATILGNAIHAEEENSQRLRKRLADLTAEMENEVKTRTRQLRLPKEHARTKAPFNVILQYGRAYPLYSERGDRKTDSIRWGERRGRHQPHPVPERGADVASVSRLYTALPKQDFYIAFYVFPDAFEAFAAAREAVSKAGFDDRLEIISVGTDLSFGKDGTTPAPL